MATKSFDLTKAQTTKGTGYKLDNWKGKIWALANVLRASGDSEHSKLANSLQRLTSVRYEADLREHYKPVVDMVKALPNKVTMANINALKQATELADNADDKFKKANGTVKGKQSSSVKVKLVLNLTLEQMDIVKAALDAAGIDY